MMNEMTTQPRPTAKIKLAIVGMDAHWGSCDGLDAFERSIYDGTQHMDAIAPQSPMPDLSMADVLMNKVANRALGNLRSPVNRVEPILIGMTTHPIDYPVALSQLLARAEAILVTQQADAVLIGAVQLNQSPQIQTQAEGAGAVIFKLLPNALAAGDRIYAVIDAIVTSRAETVAIQQASKQALQQANLEPSAIGYLEVFASSVHQENEIEIRGLLQAYQASTPSFNCAIGSVKTTIGTTPVVAGIASLIKTALCLYHRFVPATPHWPGVSTPADGQGCPFYVPTESRPWFLDTTDRRIAALSSVEPTGMYTHLLMAEELSQHNRSSQYLQDKSLYLFPIAAADCAGLCNQLHDLEQWVTDSTPLPAVAQQTFERWQGQAQAPYALAILGRNRDEVLAEIQRALQGIPGAVEAGRDWQTPAGSYFTPHPLGSKGKVAFLYSGAFGAHVGLGRNLFKLFPHIYEDMVIKSVAQRLSKIEKQLYPRSLAKLSNRQLESLEQQLMSDILTLLEAETGFASVMTAILRDSFQIQPQSVFGYSLGEITMLYAQGIWQDFYQGSQALHTSDLFRTRISGPMQAIRNYWGVPPEDLQDEQPQELWRNYILIASATEVNQCLQQEKQVYLTQINAANEVLIGGDPQACQRVITTLGCDAIRAPFNYAIHCPVIQSEYNDLAKLNCWPVHPKPDIQFYSASTYAPMTQERQSISHHIAQTLSQQIDFPRLLQRIYEDGNKLFIEVGAGGMCSRWISDALKQKEHMTVSFHRRGTDEHTSILKALAKLLSHRVALDLSPLYKPGSSQPNATLAPSPARNMQPDLVDSRHYQHLSLNSSALTKNHAVFLDSRRQSLQQMGDLIHLQTRISAQFINR
jgi:PfaB family protein